MSQFISNDKVSGRHIHERFIDDLGTLNDWGTFNHVYKDIYPPELQLKVKHYVTHVTFFKL